MKKKLTLLALAMLLGLAACGNKTEAPASAGTSANTSKETETGTVESIVEEVVEAIEEAAKPKQGDVTDKMYFSEDVFFTSATPLEFYSWTESGSRIIIDYRWDKDPNSGIEFGNGDDSAFGMSLYKPLNTPEGLYKGEITDGYMYLYFETDGKDGRKYGIYHNANDPSEEHVALFLQLVEEFLDSGVVTDAKMSDIQYDATVLSETNIANFFTSPDAIAAD